MELFTCVVKQKRDKQSSLKNVQGFILNVNVRKVIVYYLYTLNTSL